MNNFSRPLYNRDVVWDFLENVLGIQSNDTSFVDILNKIVKEEIRSDSIEDTLIPDIRDPKWRMKEDRDKLRHQIVDEMLTQKRLPSDDDVNLGSGGGLPISCEVIAERKAFYIMGLPASGKSSISSKICDMYGAFLLDSDLVKRKLPEFRRRRGASIVHEESSIITNGGEIDGESFKSILENCLEKGYNLCIPKIGSRVKSVLKFLDILKKYEYYNCIILVSLEREKSVKRAFDRFLRTNRYVPLSLIFDGYANDPILCYYRLRKYLEDSQYDYFDEMMAISSDVTRGARFSIKDERYASKLLTKYLTNLKK